MGTVTLSVNDSDETYFRRIVKEHYGASKGTIGTAASQAFRLWAEAHDQKKISARAIARMNKGYHMGKWMVKKREELYER